MTERLDEPWMHAPATAAVMAALEAVGGRGVARFVGGCVRDALVGRPVSDIDIATRLTPDVVVRALEAARLKAVPTGVDHGTVTAVSKGKPFEITTLRRDVETDGRRAVVAFTTDWAEDAARRDFRLNALYLEPDGTLHDPTRGGVEDARAGRVIFVGDARTRIREDYLRVLRFFRFFAWFGKGAPDEAALVACRELADGLAGLSGERVSKELLKLAAAPDPRGAVAEMQAAWVARVLLETPLDLGRFAAMVELTKEPELRLAALLPSDPDRAAAIAARLRLSRAQSDRLVAAAGGGPDLGLTDIEARRSLYGQGAATFHDQVLMRLAETPERDADARRLLALAQAWERPVLPVGGADARACGVAPGPAMGRLLKAVEAWWIDEDFRPDKTELLAYMADLARSGAA